MWSSGVLISCSGEDYECFDPAGVMTSPTLQKSHALSGSTAGEFPSPVLARYNRFSSPRIRIKPRR
jgi:hypothetical protein